LALIAASVERNPNGDRPRLRCQLGGGLREVVARRVVELDEIMGRVLRVCKNMAAPRLLRRPAGCFPVI
jgi:hypothetical protein